MAWSFTKQDRQRRDEIVADLNKAETELQAEHALVTAAIEAFNVKVDAYNAACGEARGFVDDMVSQIDSDMADKTERWQESDKGQAVEAWKGELEGVDLDDIEPLEIPDLPDLEHATTLEGLPEEVEG